MARGLIGKALSGAAEVAVPAALAEHKARIMAKRDEKLYGQKKELAGEEFERKKELLETKTELEKQTPGYLLDAMELNEKVTTTELTQQLLQTEDPAERRNLMTKLRTVSGDLGDPTANQKDVRAMVEAGYAKDEAEAWKKLKGNTDKDVSTIFKVLADQQELLAPGMEGYKSVPELWNMAEKISRGELKAPEPVDEEGGEEEAKSWWDRLFGGDDEARIDKSTTIDDKTANQNSENVDLQDVELPPDWKTRAPEGWTENDVKFTMKKHGLTFDELIERVK